MDNDQRYVKLLRNCEIVSYCVIETEMKLISVGDTFYNGVWESKFGNYEVSWPKQNCTHPFTKEQEVINMNKTFKIGDLVKKVKGYKYPGIIVSAFVTTKGDDRYVVECTCQDVSGMLHIYNSQQLELIKDESE